MPLTVKINVALREQICQKIGSERVKQLTKMLNPCHSPECSIRHVSALPTVETYVGKETLFEPK